MSEPVKRRRYDSPLRREQAADTRRRILEAAQERFEHDGYAATSMADVAAAAGVSLKTVYLAYQSKSGVLRALWHLRLRGDEGPAPVDERPWYRAVLAEPDPERKLRLNQENAKNVKERIGPLLGVLRGAAQVDTDIAALWARVQSDFYENQRAVVEDLHRRNALRPGLDVDRAADILWTLNHPDLYLVLVGERGWTLDELERWQLELLTAQLLRV
jgi:AcrR family transcriptional regulator